MCRSSPTAYCELQLFDVDLRIKRTLKRGTIAAAFVATFFIISESAGNFLSSQFGTVLGVLGTAALMFFLDPLHSAAERVSNAAMPNTVDTPEYEAFRKLQVYDSAIRAALEDGHISDRQPACAQQHDRVHGHRQGHSAAHGERRAGRCDGRDAVSGRCLVPKCGRAFRPEMWEGL